MSVDTVIDTDESVEYWIEEFNGLHDLYEAKKDELAECKRDLNEYTEIMYGFSGEVDVLSEALKESYDSLGELLELSDCIDCFCVKGVTCSHCTKIERAYKAKDGAEKALEIMKNNTDPTIEETT